MNNEMISNLLMLSVGIGFLIVLLFLIVQSTISANKKIRAKEDQYKKALSKFRKPEQMSISLQLLSDSLYAELREMGNSNLMIETWQKMRIKKGVITGVIIMLVGIGGGFLKIGMTFQLFLILAGIFIPIQQYMAQNKRMHTTYLSYKFERQMEFSKFTRLLTPYLKATKDGVNLFTIFNKILPRFSHDKDRDLLMTLMKEMTDNPNSIEPFLDYAEKVSGTESSILFMSTLYDLRQGSTSLQVIEELSQQASKEMMRGIDSIIATKSHRFVYTPTKLVLMILIVIFGFAGGYILYIFQDIGSLFNFSM